MSADTTVTASCRPSGDTRAATTYGITTTPRLPGAYLTSFLAYDPLVACTAHTEPSGARSTSSNTSPIVTFPDATVRTTAPVAREATTSDWTLPLLTFATYS